MSDEPDLYKRMGLSRDATAKDIKSAYRNIQLKYHPDRTHGLSADESEKNANYIKSVNDAYNILGNAESKAVYDNPPVHTQQHMHATGLNDFLTQVFGLNQMFNGNMHHHNQHPMFVHQMHNQMQQPMFMHHHMQQPMFMHHHMQQPQQSTGDYDQFLHEWMSEKGGGMHYDDDISVDDVEDIPQEKPENQQSENQQSSVTISLSNACRGGCIQIANNESIYNGWYVNIPSGIESGFITTIYPTIDISVLSEHIVMVNVEDTNSDGFYRKGKDIWID